MGILNVTPDSFSDGGAYFDTRAAIEAGLRMIDEGAGIIDVGPESTRPGSQPVSPDEQISRAIPVIEGIRNQWQDRRTAGPVLQAANENAPKQGVISIDTRLAAVAEAAIGAGATMVNDTSALRDDPALVDCVARTGVELVLMHRRGTPATMQQGGGPIYNDVVAEIREFLRERVMFAVENGVDPSRILVDPGIGFGKRVEDNVAILRNVGAFNSVGPSGHPHVPVLIGVSRKRFIGSLLGIDDPVERDAASVVFAVFAVHHGAEVVRVHDVRRTVEGISLWQHLSSNEN
jgi:dihydropteroate synthase